MIKLDVDNYCQNCDYFESEVNILDFYGNDTLLNRDTLITCRNRARCKSLLHYYLNISCPKFKPCVDYEMMYIYHNAKEDSIRRK